MRRCIRTELHSDGCNARTPHQAARATLGSQQLYSECRQKTERTCTHTKNMRAKHDQNRCLTFGLNIREPRCSRARLLTALAATTGALVLLCAGFGVGYSVARGTQSGTKYSVSTTIDHDAVRAGARALQSVVPSA